MWLINSVGLLLFLHYSMLAERWVRVRIKGFWYRFHNPAELTPQQKILSSTVKKQLISSGQFIRHY